jgi:anti-sigma B factor antagonist
MNIQKSRPNDSEDSFVVIKLLDEKLNSSNSAALKGEFVVLDTEGSKNVILNMSEVTYADSSGLSAILIGNRLFKSSGGILVMCSLTPFVEKLIKISKLDDVLNILPTEQEARERVFMHILEREIEEGEEEKSGDSIDDEEGIPTTDS